MIGIVAAIEREVSDFLRIGRFKRVPSPADVGIFESSDMPGVAVVTGGAGRERAERATRLMIDEYDPHLLVSAGFAGAATPSANTGDLFVCSRVLALTGPAAKWSAADLKLRTLVGSDAMSQLSESIGTIGGCWGSCVTVDHIVCSGNLKGWLGQNLGADVIDMESFWVSDVAATASLPHLVIRSVMDPMAQRLPGFVADLGGHAGHLGPGALVRAAMQALMRPADLFTALQLPGQVRRAGLSLAGALAAMVSTNAWAPALGSS